MTNETKGMWQLIAIGVGLVAVGAAIPFEARRRLRRRHIVVPLVVLVLTVPVPARFLHDIRTHAGGEGAAWGRLGELMILLPLLPVICIAIGALVGAVFALGMFGLGDPAAIAQPRLPWYVWLVRSRGPEHANRRLLAGLVSITVVGVLWLMGVRPGA